MRLSVAMLIEAGPRESAADHTTNDVMVLLAILDPVWDADRGRQTIGPARTSNFSWARNSWGCHHGSTSCHCGLRPAPRLLSAASFKAVRHSFRLASGAPGNGKRGSRLLTPGILNRGAPKPWVTRGKISNHCCVSFLGPNEVLAPLNVLVVGWHQNHPHPLSSSQRSI
jgi:hypothetical protein